MNEKNRDELTEKVRFIQREGSLDQEETLILFIQQLYQEVRDQTRTVKKDGNVVFLPSEPDDLDDPKLWSKKKSPAPASEPAEICSDPTHDHHHDHHHDHGDSEPEKMAPGSGKTAKFLSILLIPLTLGILTYELLKSPGTDSSQPPTRVCDIKGNINESGNRIYHLPGGEWYDKARVEPEKGEKWFCSTAEAEAAGWRKSLK